VKYVLLKGVAEEIRQSALFYNNESYGLGLDFARKVKNTIKSIIQFPEAWTRFGDNFRQCQLERFPFSVVYYVEPNRIVVVAVAHQKRRPGYWENRVK
jgi:hypothetical protein